MRSDRVQVTVSHPMKVALNILADRNGLTVSAQAAMMLRQSLTRTIESAEAQRRIRLHVAGRTRNEWQEETTTEHAIEQAFAAWDGRVIEEHDSEQAGQDDTAPVEATADNLGGGDAGQADAVAGTRVPRAKRSRAKEATA